DVAVRAVTRLRRHATWGPAAPPRSGRRGRPRVYGEHRVELAKRAGQRRGWATGTFTLYGKATAKRYKTFVATWRPAGGAIRGVLVGEATGGGAVLCTEPGATV